MKTILKFLGTALLLQSFVFGQSSFDQNFAGQVASLNNSAYGMRALGNTNMAWNNLCTAVGYEAMYAPLGAHNYYCTALGFGAMRRPNATGHVIAYNVALGAESQGDGLNGGFCTSAGYRSMYSNFWGQLNVATGSHALLLNRQAGYNTAVGANAMYNNNSVAAAGTQGNYNAALGFNAMYANIDGNENTALGANALYNLQHGGKNTAAGFNALYSTPGSSANENAAAGHSALYSNDQGYNNTATGVEAMYSNTNGYRSSALGYHSLHQNQLGEYNTAVGANAMELGTYGQYNVGIGGKALWRAEGDFHTAVGFEAYAHCPNIAYANIAIGFRALQHPSPGDAITAVGEWANTSFSGYYNSTAFGSRSLVNASNKVWMGNVAVTGVYGTPGAWSTWPSDQRFKSNVDEGVKGLEFILKLRPVVYNLDGRKLEEFLVKNLDDAAKKEYLSLDFEPATAIRQSGFIAQEVEAAMKECDYNFDGLYKPKDENDNYALKYALFVVPLTKAVQQQDEMIVEEQEALKGLMEQISALDKILGPQAAGSVAGINEQTGASLKEGFSMDIQPNPFSYETVVNYTLPAHVKTAVLIITDLEGKQIQSKQLPTGDKGSMVFTSEHLSAGIYLYSISSEGKLLGTKRMIVAGK